MVEQCKPYLAFDTFTNATLANYIQRMKEHALERKAREDENPSGIVGKAGRTITDAGKWVGSFWPFSSSDKTEPKEKMIRSYCFSVENPNYGETPHWTLFRVQDSYSTMYKAISNPQDRTPGQCDDRSTEAHTPLYKLGETNEFMHPSVKWRIDMSQDHKEKDHQYKPKPLAVFDYKQRDGVYGWEHKTDKNGNAEKKVWIPEWPITAALQDEDPESYAENAEMALIDQCKDKADVREFLKKHADAWVKAYSSKL